jgi:uncharacterized protein DUF6789
MRGVIGTLFEGGIAGFVATGTMSAVMLAGEKIGLLGDHPPEILSEHLLHVVGINRKKEGKQDVLAVALHFGFGASMGAVFGLLRRTLHPPIPAPLPGIGFATLVWAVSYKGWIPALGILPPPEHDRPGRPQVMVAAHWVYGATLELCLVGVDRRRARSETP